MDKPGQQFLAGTTLGLDQYIGAGTGGSTGPLQGLQQQGRTADDSRTGTCDGYVFTGKLIGGCLVAYPLHDAGGRGLQLFKRYWFG